MSEDIEQFREQAFELIVRLGLPLVHDEDHTLRVTDIAQLYIAMCFPNLSDLERGIILGGHLAARGVTYGVNTETPGLDREQKEEIEEAICLASHQYLPDVAGIIEQTGLRAKLSGFQEALLDDLLRVQFKEGRAQDERGKD